MGKALTKSQVVAGIAEKAGITKKQAAAAVESLVGAKVTYELPPST